MATTTDNFDLFNFKDTKNISVVVSIEGVPTKFSNRTIFTKVRYGDPGIEYGDPGLIFGALRPVTGIEENLVLGQSSLTIQQRLEPEQGRASVSVISMAFLDKNQVMSGVVSPGIVVDEILGKNVTVELGYREISYPEDYYVIFRGIITAVQALPGVITMQFSDPNVKRRQTIFFSAATSLTSGIDSTQQTINVAATGDFHQQILGPDGGYDSAITTYIKIEDEFIEYPATGIASETQFINCVRGSRGTANVAHDAGTEVLAYIEIEDHAIDMALKIMLSGWAGSYVDNVDVEGFVETNFPGIGAVPNAIVFNVDVVREYGLTVGDYVTTTGASLGANNVTLRQITSISDFDTDNPNRYIVVDGASLVTETPTAAVASLRSQYDTYPESCGLRLSSQEVDIEGHEDLKAQFLSDNENSYRFLINAQESGKTFIEKEIYYPVSAYSLTRNGQMSVKLTKPPLASADIVTLSKSNILNATSIRPMRAVNSRTFFNEIAVDIDQDDDGKYTNNYRFLSTESLATVGISSVLPIQSRGIKSDLSTDISLLIQRRAEFLLSRYRSAAVQFDVICNFGTGNQIEAGDAIILDGTDLQITNFNTGKRDLPKVLFEVLSRKLNISNGRVTVTLVASLGADITDRFATIAPSSLLDTGSTTTQLIIKDSFTAADPKYPGEEGRKWENYIGETLAVHDENYTFYEEITLLAIDPLNPYLLTITPLSVPPPANYILNIGRYPTTTDPNTGSILKQSHVHFSPTVDVTSGLSDTSFQVAVGEAPKFLPDAAIRVHSSDFSSDSLDVFVDTVVGVTITTKTSMGFTPTPGMRVDLIGFADAGGAYRWI